MIRQKIRRPEISLQQGKAAPPGYYASNLSFVVDFVLSRNSQLIAFTHLIGLTTFLGLSEPAKRLFSRLLIRTGPVFLVSSLSYEEIPDLTSAIRKLEASGLIDSKGVSGETLLRKLTKDQICDGFPLVQPSPTKKMLIEQILSNYSDHRIISIVNRFHPWIRIANRKTWTLLRILFFGNRHRDWSSFITEDLGQTKWEEVPLTRPLFEDAGQFSTHVRLIELSDLSKRCMDYVGLASEISAELTQLEQKDRNDRYFKKTALALGQFFERQAKWKEATAIYDLIKVHPARERQIRIYKKLQMDRQKDLLLNAILVEPYSALELQFARRMLGEKSKAPPTSIEKLHKHQDFIENYAMENFFCSAKWIMHCENAFFRALVGLIYWPAIFTPLSSAFTNPYQAAPNDLFHEGFFIDREHLIEGLERELSDDASFLQHVSSVYYEKQGISNRLVSWSLFERISIEEWLKAIPIKVLRNVSSFLIRNLSDFKSGIPDLFVCYGDEEFELVEIKGPTDRLQPQQQAWFDVLPELGVPARVLKFQYE